MSQSISFMQFNAQSVERFWGQCLYTNFNIATTSQIEGLANIARYVEKGDYSDTLESAVWEIDDLIVYHFSRRHFFEYEEDVVAAIAFWLKVQLDKSFRNDFGGNIEKIDTQTWRALFAEPKNLNQIKDLAQAQQELQDLSPEDLLDYYLKIKDVFEYSELTDTEMVVLPEDRSLSRRWTARLSDLSTKAVPVLHKLYDQGRQAELQYREPPFITIPVASKEFFVPTITVVSQGSVFSLDYEDQSSHELRHDVWASRVLPGETYKAAITRELAQTLGYAGSYQVVPMKTLLDQVPDRSGNLVNRYGIQIKLVDEINTDVQVGDYHLVLTSQPRIAQATNAQHADSASPTRKDPPTRDEVITALKKVFAIVPPERIEDPGQMSKQPETADLQEVKDAERLYDEWFRAGEEKAKASGEEARAVFYFTDSTIYWDAGFDAVGYLEELAGDWLFNDLSRADELHLRTLSNKIKATIDDIDRHIRELKPRHKLVNWEDFYQQSWNPSRTAPPTEFYNDYAYRRGGSAKTEIDDVLARYMRFHPDAQDAVVRSEMERAAANYKER